MNEAAVYEKLQQLLEGIGDVVVNTQEFLNHQKNQPQSDREEILQKAIDTYGANAQIGIAQEECAELIQAISKIRRGGGKEALEKLHEEMADVQIMLDQLKIIFGYSAEIEQRKIERLKERLEAGE